MLRSVLRSVPRAVLRSVPGSVPWSVRRSVLRSASMRFVKFTSLPLEREASFGEKVTTSHRKWKVLKAKEDSRAVLCDTFGKVLLG